MISPVLPLEAFAKNNNEKVNFYLLMSRFIGSKTQLSKRVGRNLFLKGARSFSAKDDYSKKPQKPGVHGGGKSFAKISEYSKQLTEKQALRFTYGLTEKQLANTFKRAFKAKDETGYGLFSLLERRLDNVVYRAGLANSRAQARQLVNHGHFLLNGIRASIPSMLVSAADKIEVKPAKAKNAFWTNFQLEVPNEQSAWLSKKDRTINVINEPTADDLPKEFNPGYIIEYYSRRVN